eukprot:COSAG02_NODE_1545_length_11996_cov_6.889636_4_plen_265_part_00
MHFDTEIQGLLEEVHGIWKAVGVWANQNWHMCLVCEQLGQHLLQLRELYRLRFVCQGRFLLVAIFKTVDTLLAIFIMDVLQQCKGVRAVHVRRDCQAEYKTNPGRAREIEQSIEPRLIKASAGQRCGGVSMAASLTACAGDIRKSCSPREVALTAAIRLWACICLRTEALDLRVLSAVLGVAPRWTNRGAGHTWVGVRVTRPASRQCWLDLTSWDIVVKVVVSAASKAQDGARVTHELLGEKAEQRVAEIPLEPPAIVAAIKGE